MFRARWRRRTLHPAAFKSKYFDKNGLRKNKRNALSDCVHCLHIFSETVSQQSTADTLAVMRKDLTKLLDIQQKVDILSNTVSAATSSLGITGGSNSEIQAALTCIESYQSGLMNDNVQNAVYIIEHPW